jgi:hypothetical protein
MRYWQTPVQVRHYALLRRGGILHSSAAYEGASTASHAPAFDASKTASWRQLG